MSSRAELKAAARRQREEREEHARRAAEGRRARLRLAVVTAAAATVVAGAIVVAGTARHDPATTRAAAAPVAAGGPFAGIPQHGIALGSPKARATLVEFADLQCPYCGLYARDVLRSVVRRYVRPGKLRLESHLLTFVGPDSMRAGRMASAAVRQDRLWDFTESFYANQGQENTGYVTDDYLKRVGTSAGLDVDAARRDQARPEADAVLQTAKREASRLGVQSTPSFFLRRGDGALRPLDVSRLTPDAFRSALDDAL